MRISEFEKEVIITSIRKNFNEVERIILFGSRIDDSKRGGDIDVLLPTSDDDAFIKKIQTLTDMQLRLGEQRIDLITADADDERLIVKKGKEEGLVLWTK